jgi:DNA helicase IV
LSVRQVDDLHAAVREAVRQAPRDATVAVIAADDAAEQLVPLVDVPEVALVPASLVKGLEYDHVIVVEPADIVAAEPRGLNRLYVALTRAVAGLVVLHQDALPAALRD